jgi:hypothetical protein
VGKTFSNIYNIDYYIFNLYSMAVYRYSLYWYYYKYCFTIIFKIII